MVIIKDKAMRYANIILALFVSVLFGGCVREEIRQDGCITIRSVDAIVTELPATKAHLEKGSAIVWDAGDQIGVFSDSQDVEYYSNGEEGDALSRFSGNPVSGTTFYAIYPANGFNPEDRYSLRYQVPQPKAGTNPSMDLPMVAKLENGVFKFKQTMGLIHFSFQGNQTIKSLSLSGNNEEGINGVGTINIQDSQPCFSLVESFSSTIEFLPEEPYTLSDGETWDVYIPFAPMSLSDGFSLTITYIDYNNVEKKVIKKTNHEVTIPRAGIRNYTLVDLDELIEETEEVLSLERNALIAIYNALDGDHWTNNENWCSDKPVGEWYGISVDDNGFVSAIEFWSNNLTGSIPEQIGCFTHLINLTINTNAITGRIPASIANLKDLYSFDCGYCQLDGGLENLAGMPSLKIIDMPMNRFSGEIPKELASIPNVESLFLWGNEFTGSIPKEFGNCQELRCLNLISNYLSGEIPSELKRAPKLTSLDFSQNCFKGKYPQWLLEDERFRDAWLTNAYGNLFDLSDMPGPIFEIKDINGHTMSSEDYYHNRYTIILKNTPDLDISNFKSIYEKYNSIGLEIYSLIQGWDIPTEYYHDDMARKTFVTEQANEYIVANSIPWRCAVLSYDNHFTHYMDQGHIVFDHIPVVTVINNEGRIVYYWGPAAYPTGYVLDEPGWKSFLHQLGEEFPVGYTSSDYSHDGDVKTIQTATSGRGLDFVFIGDGYTDRLIVEGKFDSDIEKAIDALFSEEPYRSNRQLFNIYSVTVVSPNEEYTEGSTTALRCRFDDSSTAISADNGKCFSYIMDVLSEERVNDATVIVLVNKDTYAGTCNLYPIGKGDYARGLSICFIPTIKDIETFSGLVSHEIGGHGFAKLADEYAYEENGAFPHDSDLPQGVFIGSVKDGISQMAYGWFKNVDFTNDPTKVKWSHFLSDGRYANEGLGCYEGGMTYWTGVWRPTENSIMNTNTGGFNAPSREAIWYRIHKLAYGESWEYDYEDFVAWDQVNRTPAATSLHKAQMQRQRLSKPLPPLAPPVVIGHSWREEVDKDK